MSAEIQCYNEILTQESAWAEAVEVTLKRQDEINAFFEAAKPTEVFFIGCTSPLYAGMAASGYWKACGGMSARALPSSELVMFPWLYLSKSDSRPILIVLSRSGKTTETIWAMEEFERRFPGRSVLIGCNPEGALAKIASLKLFLPQSAEKTIAQTRSLGSMLLSSLLMASLRSQDSAAVEMLKSAPARASAILKNTEETIQGLFKNKRFHNIFILGGGFFQGIAMEAGLKCLEMSTTDTFSYTFMESRHGPRSVVDEDSLVVGLYSQSGVHYEAKVMEEYTRKHGATTLAITPSRGWETGAVSATVSLDSDWPDELRGLLYLPPTQLVAYYCARSKGLNPDKARLHTQYVEIERFYVQFNTPQETIAYAGRILFERKLLDLAGGNISLRVGEEIYITPRYSGARQQWNVDPATIVTGRIDTDVVLHHPNFSREGQAHLAIYRRFPEANAVIHSHSFHVMAFCAAGRPIPPVLEATQKFGEVQVLPYAPAHSKELADSVVQALEGQRERITKHAASLVLAKHGLITISKDMFLCMDAVERIDWNAWCVLAQKLLPEA